MSEQPSLDEQLATDLPNRSIQVEFTVALDGAPSYGGRPYEVGLQASWTTVAMLPPQRDGLHAAEPLSVELIPLAMPVPNWVSFQASLRNWVGEYLSFGPPWQPGLLFLGASDVPAVVNFPLELSTSLKLGHALGGCPPVMASLWLRRLDNRPLWEPL